MSSVLSNRALDLVKIIALPGDASYHPRYHVLELAVLIPIRLLILKFVPPMYHVLVGSACSFVWQIIMALTLKK